MDPRTFRTNADGSAVCPHRDLSVCRECAALPGVVDVYGAHYVLPPDDAAASAFVIGQAYTADEVRDLAGPGAVFIGWPDEDEGMTATDRADALANGVALGSYEPHQDGCPF